MRAFLRDRAFDVVVHGHKHEHAAQFDHVYDHAGIDARRVLVVSGATFDSGRETDAVRLLTFEGVTLHPIDPRRAYSAAARRRGCARHSSDHEASLGLENITDGPTTVQGSDIDEVYERVVEVARAEAEGIR